MFGFNYTDTNREILNQYNNVTDLVTYLKSQNLVEKLANYATSNGVKRRNLMIQKSHDLLEKRLLGRIIYNILGQEASMEYLNKDDETVQTAIGLLAENKSFPMANSKNTAWNKIPYRPFEDVLSQVLIPWDVFEANQYAMLMNCSNCPDQVLNPILYWA